MQAVPALQWLAVGLMLLYVNSILGVTLVSLNEERKLTLLAALALVAQSGPQPEPHPALPACGAAVTTAATEGFILAYLLAVMPRDLLARSTFDVFAKAAVASAAMALVLVALRRAEPLLLIPLGGAVYALVGALLRLVPPDDFRLIGSALGRRGRVAEAEETQA